MDSNDSDSLELGPLKQSRKKEDNQSVTSEQSDADTQSVMSEKSDGGNQLSVGSSNSDEQPSQRRQRHLPKRLPQRHLPKRLPQRNLQQRNQQDNQTVISEQSDGDNQSISSEDSNGGKLSVCSSKSEESDVEMSGQARDDYGEDYNYTSISDTDIQKHPQLKAKLSDYDTFLGCTITKAYDGEKVEPGLRVVQQFMTNNDSKARCIGTIMQVDDTDQIVVQWDRQDTQKNDVFDKEDNNQYKLLLFDNAQTGVRHAYVLCDGCKESPLRGIRWKCQICADYNLCTKCYMGDEHRLDHVFTRIISPNSKGVQMAPRRQMTNKSVTSLPNCGVKENCEGIIRNATVVLRDNPNMKGQVKQLLNKDIGALRSKAKVKWNEDKIQVHSVGWKGQCDLKFVSETEGIKYYKEHLQTVHYENSRKGERVVRGPKWDRDKLEDGGEGFVGTIIDISNNKDEITVQWDNGNKTITPGDHLQILDTGPSGVKYNDYVCGSCLPNDTYIQGVRWECTKCKDFNLCNICYMSDKHKIRHKFHRFVGTYTRTTVELRENASDRVQSFGIFQGATVKLAKEPGRKEKGVVIEIVASVKDKGRNMVKVEWNSQKKDVRQMLDLKMESGGTFSYYPDHLPVLGQYTDGYCEVDFRGENTKYEQIKVYIWRNIQDNVQKKEQTFKPSVYLIFANSESDEKEKNNELMTEIINFSSKTRLPCHIVAQKVLLHGGSTNTACIHNETNKATIKELMDHGFNKFQRCDNVETDDSNDEIDYFRKMAEYALGEPVLPIIISINSGGTDTEVMESATKAKIPIIRLQKNTTDVSVVWPTDGDDKREHKTTTKMPWRIKKTKVGKIVSTDEVEFISEIRCDVETLVCCSIIGVYMEEELSAKGKQGAYDYPTALAMYLLKKEKWIIPKKHITVEKPFGQNPLEYIYEEVISADFLKELEISLSKMGYKRPKLQGHGIELNKWDSECYGHIFFALLQKQYWAGAKQLVETGFIRIHHILVGCAILEDTINSWKTTTDLKEKLRLLKGAFTERAICITSCMYEADKKKENDATEEKDSNGNPIDKELGDCINEAGRLLLNHGYVRDAIDTKNNTFLENDTVKKILNKKWYGTEQINFKSISSLLFLAAVHLFVLPLLMINMEARPLLCLYKKYKLPFLKVVIHMLGFLVLLLAYAYMLLFDYNDNGISMTDCFIIVWIASFFVDEIKQVTVAIVSGKIKSYTRDWWNILDWLLIIGYTCGMLLRAGEGSGFQILSKCLLVTAFMLLCIRILSLCCMTEFLGPKLVIINKMIKDTIAFMIIMAVIMVWYSVSFYALLYPNSEFSFKQIETILSNGYWMLFGELNLDSDTLTVPYCTFNRTISSSVLQRCPSQLGVYLTPYLKAFYVLIAVVLLLNLLIAMYSHSFNEVQQKSEFYWRQQQTDFLEEYTIKTVFPVHLQLLALPGIILAILWFCYSYLKRKLSGKSEEKHFNHRPMIVRVFLYDTNYDLKLDSTEKAEENGALNAKGTIHFEDVDAIKAEERIQNIEDGLKEIKKNAIASQKIIEEKLDDIESMTQDSQWSIEQKLEDIEEMLSDEQSEEDMPDLFLNDIQERKDTKSNSNKSQTNKDKKSSLKTSQETKKDLDIPLSDESSEEEIFDLFDLFSNDSQEREDNESNSNKSQTNKDKKSSLKPSQETKKDLDIPATSVDRIYSILNEENERNKQRNQEIMSRLQTIDNSLKDLKDIKEMIANMKKEKPSEDKDK